ncbi:MAG: pentapeptide repeat-containing protein [Alphaproteobacteria bacterium]|nr:pentapeptide repeat-containing protein [Alphaproteobacteria bacterium]
MVAKEDKIAELKAIRDKTRAEMAFAEDLEPIEDQFLEEDDSFPPHEDLEADFAEQAGFYDDDSSDDVNSDDFDEDDDFDDDEEGDDDDESSFPVDDKPSSSSSSSGWHAVSFSDEDEEDLPLLNIEFNGKNLENGEFDHENLRDANFSAANLSGVNFCGSDLRGADFSGANLTNTDLSNADLTGATFAGAQIIGTNFSGAILKNVTFTDAFFQDAVLLDIEIDSISLEELQQLIEFVAKYYPEKLDLTRINLTMLDLRKIDLSKVNLRGVDFTGVDFSGVNIMELDLSECIITPEQIAQALGRVPSADELKRILAPKKRKPRPGLNIDFTDFFLNGHKQVGIIDVGGFKGMDVEKLVKFGKKIHDAVASSDKAPVDDKDSLEYIRAQNRANKQELRELIEERKRRELENRRREKQRQTISRDRNAYQR